MTALAEVRALLRAAVERLDKIEQERKPEPILVLSRNRREFEHWCDENGHNPNSPHVVYASSKSAVRGLSRDTRWILFGTFLERSDASAIFDYVCEAYQPMERAP